MSYYPSLHLFTSFMTSLSTYNLVTYFLHIYRLRKKEKKKKKKKKRTSLKCSSTHPRSFWIPCSVPPTIQIICVFGLRKKQNSAGNLVKKFVPSHLVPENHRPLDSTPVRNLLRSRPPEILLHGDRFSTRRRRRRRWLWTFRSVRRPLFFDGSGL